ncbi:MAG TPA: VWA domain-containing protein [Terracidiphilus sp.]|jgi:VWFA-related protein|nr:VWA domain-containing protein [Terracidiphilus sp.]
MRLTFVGALLCFVGFALDAHAQNAPQPPSAQSSLNQVTDPTRPELQQRLDVDRDPIPSPDPDEVPTTATAGSNGTAASKPGEIQKDQKGVYTLHANVDEVLLNCSVIDEDGHTVDDLSQNDFRVWEDGVPQTVNSVVHQDTPVSMGILVDNSGSMRDKRSAVSTAALKLLKASNPRDTAFIVNFSEHAYLDQGFTSDLVSLNRGLSRNDAQGTTAMYDAVSASADELVKHAKERKQALLIITDGADNASRLTLAEAVRRVQNLGGPVVYTIGLLFDVDEREADQARNALESLSEETGGIAYFPRSVNDLDAIAAEVAHDIRNQYVIDYRSTKSASLGGYRAIRVEVKPVRRGKFTVRTKKGYFAQPTQKPTQISQTATP